MKLPGLAWLELAVGRDHDGMTTYSQRAIFQPRGLAGHAYWRSISPFHGVIFGGMQRNITAAAERAGRPADKPVTRGLRRVRAAGAGCRSPMKPKCQGEWTCRRC
jgi:Protein of unknown function (DUF2867)